MDGPATATATATKWGRGKILRMVALSVVVAVGAVWAYFILEGLSNLAYWRARLAFLIGLEVAYGVAVVAIVVGLPLLATWLVRARRRGRRRPLAARGLLLGVSLLFGLALCELTTAVIRPRSPVAVGPAPRQSEPIEPIIDSRDVALPTKLTREADDGVVNVVILGESSAEGVPYNFWISIAPVVTWQLEEAIPGRKFRPVILAESGHTLERQHKRLAELNRRPGVIVIYCGHNEFSARFHVDREPPHYLEADPMPPWEVFVDRLEKTSPLCGLIRAAADQCRVAIPPPRGSLRALVDVPAFTPAERDAILADFARRLEAMVSYAESLGAVPILIVPPASDSAFEPNRSYLPPETSRAERQAFAQEFLAVRKIEERDPAEALRRYRALADRGPGFAEVHYRIGRLLERSGDFPEAARQDALARDFDGLTMRSPTAIGDIYRDVAASHRCPLIDGPAYLRAIAPNGLLDDHLFHDGMHPSLRGLLALAQAVLGEIRDRRLFGWPESTPAPILDPALCVSHFHIGPQEWVRLCWWGVMFYDLTGPARYDSSQRWAKQEAFLKAARAIESGAAAESVGLPNIGIPKAVPIVPHGGAKGAGKSGKDEP